MRDSSKLFYVGRLYLFGIPLWKVAKTKREWLEIAALTFTKKKTIEYIFSDEKNQYVRKERENER